MNDTSLAEVVRQLEGEACESSRREDTVPSSGTAAASTLREELFEGLRATEWLLSDLRERCRQLHGYRLRLIEKLHQLDAGDGIDGETDDEVLQSGVVPGPIAVQ